MKTNLNKFLVVSITKFFITKRVRLKWAHWPCEYDSHPTNSKCNNACRPNASDTTLFKNRHSYHLLSFIRDKPARIDNVFRNRCHDNLSPHHPSVLQLHFQLFLCCLCVCVCVCVCVWSIKSYPCDPNTRDKHVGKNIFLKINSHVHIGFNDASTSIFISKLKNNTKKSCFACCAETKQALRSLL